jgi:hypothetical protein
MPAHEENSTVVRRRPTRRSEGVTKGVVSVGFIAATEVWISGVKGEEGRGREREG